MSTSKVFLNYTDAHDVDENKMTIMSQGGRWDRATWAGATYRYVFDTPTTALVSVASVCRHLKYSLIIRMHMMSTNLWQLSAISVDILMLGKSA